MKNINYNSFKFTFYILFLSYIPSLYSQPVFEEKLRLTVIKYQIKSMTSWDYVYTGDKVSKNGYKSAYNSFDSKGSVIETITYKMQDTLSHETYQYNKDGHRIDYTKKNGLKIIYKKSSKYNTNGSLLEESGYDGVSKFKNIYDYEDSKRTKQILYYIDNKIKEKRTFSNKGNIADVTVYAPNGDVRSYIALKYDEKNNVVEETFFDVNKYPLEKKTYVFNSNNELVSEVKYRQGSFYYKLTYLYNSRGDLTNIDEENPDERKYQKKIFSYDENGNLTVMQWRRNSYEDFSTRNYTYDSKNVCTKYETYYPRTKFRVLTKVDYN